MGVPELLILAIPLLIFVGLPIVIVKMINRRRRNR